MKKFLLLVVLLCPLTGLAQSTAGYHRVAQVLARAPQTVNAQVVPYASVSVSVTSTGAAAVIYSDPGLSVQITPPLVRANDKGTYDYYIALNYMVTETISSPGQGLQVISNVGENASGGTVTAAFIATTIQTQTGCSTAGFVWVPASNTCVAQTGGGGSFDPASPGPIGGTKPSTVYATDSITEVTPWADIRAYGGTCNGSADDTSAFQSAVTALGAVGGAIYSDGCYIANPLSITWPTYSGANGSLVIKIQGTLKVGSTFPANDYVDFVGLGGCQGNQFWSGPLGCIQGPATVGTLGTGVSAGSATFTPSTMTGIYIGTVLTVAEQTTCSISSVARTSNVVTATFASACTIPPGLYVTIAGVSGFNGTFIVNAADYVLSTLRWNQTASDASSSGGTATGYSENKFENVVITGTTSTTATATFVYPHAATAIWGIVGMYMTGMGEHTLRGISVNSSGVGILQYQTSNAHFYNVTAGGLYGPTSWGLEVNESFTNYYNDSVFQNYNQFSSWGVRVTNTNLSTGDPAGNLYFKGGSISGGMKLDRTSGMPAGNIYLDGTIIEEPTRGAFAVDLSTGGHGLNTLSLTNSMLQDNLYNYSECLITSLYPTPSGTLILHDVQTDGVSGGCVANSYFNGRIEYDNWSTISPRLWTEFAKPIHITNGSIVEEELRGVAADLHPSLIPYATQPVPAVSAWSSAGNCTVATGTLSPDGTTDAITLTATASGNFFLSPYAYTYTPAVGDVILFGGWTYPHGGNQDGGNYQGMGLIGISTDGSGYQIDQGTGPYVQAGTQMYSMGVQGDWWHTSVGYAKVTSTDGLSHQVRLNTQCSSTGAVDIWNTWMMIVPASAGVSGTEIARWRQQLMHGYVPPSASAGTLATSPALTLAVLTAFPSLTGGTNTAAAMLVGTGASLAPTGTGTITATSAPYSGLTGTVPTWNQSTTGNAATATALAGTPTQCTGGQVPTGIVASGNATGCFTPSGGSSAFGALTGGTNTAAAMLVGTGASLAPTGTGTISANATAGMAATGSITFNSGSLQICWNTDTCIQKGASGQVSFGNGTAFDTSGSALLGSVLFFNGTYRTWARPNTLTADRNLILPDADSNPVQPLSSAPTGGCVGYIDNMGVQHGATCSGGSGMIWPAAAGIMVYAGGSAYGTSLTAPLGAIVGTTDTQTLTNKTVDGVSPTVFSYLDPTSSVQTQLNAKQATLTNPVTGPGSGAISGHGAKCTNAACTTIDDIGYVPVNPSAINNVTNDAQTKAAIVPNTVPSAAQVLVGNAGSTAYAPVSLSGPVSITPAGVTSVGTLNQNTTGTAANVTGMVAVANGGNGTASPGLTSGNSNCSWSGSWPTQQITCTGSGGGATLQTNGTNNSSQSTLNFVNSSTDAAGLHVTASNPTGGNEVHEVTVSNQQAAINALTGTQTSGTYLRSNGTNSSLSTIQAADLPPATTSQFGAVKPDGTTITVASGVISATSAPTMNEWVSGPGYTSGLPAPAQNATRLWSLEIPVNLNNPTYLMLWVSTADNTANSYDFGIYNSSGTLLCHVGATAGTTLTPSTGLKNWTLTAGCGTMPAGRYYLGETTNCSSTCAAIYSAFAVGNSAYPIALTGGTPTSGSATSGGALNGTIGIPSDSWTLGLAPVVVLHK